MANIEVPGLGFVHSEPVTVEATVNPDPNSANAANQEEQIAALATLQTALNMIRPVALGTGISVAAGAASAQSAQISGTLIRVCSTVPARILIGANPTALSTSTLLAPYVPEYFRIANNDRVAALREGSVDGTVSITPVT